MNSVTAPLSDDPTEIAADVAAVGRLPFVPSLLRVLCDSTGMGFAAVARVTDHTWTACAVRDQIAFGLQPGGQLELATTLCNEVRSKRTLVAIDHASSDPQYREHHTPRLYGIESYISVPIVLSDGRYFGNLCAIDPKPAQVKVDRIVTMFTLFAEMIAQQLQTELSRLHAEATLHEERVSGELREQFIAVLGHDLRNPLQAISASADVLVHVLKEPRQSEIAQRVRRNATRMSGLIDQLMDFARGRFGGGLQVARNTNAGLRDGLLAVLREMSDAHPERKFSADIAELPAVDCDLPRIQQLVSNLLGNAVTHGDRTEAVTMTASVVADELRIAVHNFGEPIPEAVRMKMFSPFWRRSVDPMQGGLGLGLHICNEIIRAHDGSIAVTSTIDGGTRFEARLPVRSRSAG